MHKKSSSKNITTALKIYITPLRNKSLFKIMTTRCSSQPE